MVIYMPAIAGASRRPAIRTKPAQAGCRWSVHLEPPSGGFVCIAGALMPRRRGLGDEAALVRPHSSFTGGLNAPAPSAHPETRPAHSVLAPACLPTAAPPGGGGRAGGARS